MTDTLGLLLTVSVHPASVQDRDGAEALLREARRSFPFLERVVNEAPNTKAEISQGLDGSLNIDILQLAKAGLADRVGRAQGPLARSIRGGRSNLRG